VNEFWQQFIQNIQQTTWPEIVAVVTGIASVWFSRSENILVYPVGLINTLLYIYLSFINHLFGEAAVNLYYSIMSIYGWVLWSKKDRNQHRLVVITGSSGKEWLQHIGFFSFFYITIFLSLSYLKRTFTPGAIPWADAFASATAFTGMWLMAKKKVESWYWWIATNIASIPLFYVKHLAMTSVYYAILLVMAVFGLLEWSKRKVRA